MPDFESQVLLQVYLSGRYVSHAEMRPVKVRHKLRPTHHVTSQGGDSAVVCLLLGASSFHLASLASSRNKTASFQASPSRHLALRQHALLVMLLSKCALASQM